MFVIKHQYSVYNIQILHIHIRKKDIPNVLTSMYFTEAVMIQVLLNGSSHIKNFIVTMRQVCVC